jgi:hypothetical protein
VRYLISHDAEGRIIGWSMASAGLSVPDGCIELDREPDRDFDRVIDGRIVDTFDPRIAAEREAEFERIAELFPTLRDAVPPVPIERQNGKFRFAAREVFDDFAARVERGEWTLPPADPRTLVGPFRAVGACLAPVGCNGSLYWFDPTIPARDDDIVLVRWDPRTLEALIRRCRHRPEWVATYGERPGPIATKLLKAFAGRYWLVTNESMMPLGRNQILGVMRRAERDGRELYALAVRNIQPGAATQVAQVTAAGPTTISLTAPSTSHDEQVLWTSITVPSDDDVFYEVSCSFRVAINPTGGTWTAKVCGMDGPDSPTTLFAALSQEIPIESSGVYESIVVVGLRSNATLTPSSTRHFGIGVRLTGDGSNSVDAVFRDMTVRLAQIIR